MKCVPLCGLWIIAIVWTLSLGEVKGQFDANFTLQNVWGRLQPDMRSLIQCLSDENYKKVKFSRMMDTGQGAKLPKSSQQFLQAKPIYARILFMPGNDKSTRFGVFQCKSVKQNVETRIVTLKLPPSSLVELDALSPYNVANLGDSVTLEVNVTKKLELPVKWRHDGKEVPEWSGLTKIELKDVQVSNAGIYECYYDGRRNEGVHALMRLLVRSCPDELYGTDCDKECPPCYNGGICQDKFGVCVCPAGFAGENCEIACGGNHFGPDCSKFCSPPQNNSNTDELCASHLFCKPDPYGCSCAPGFKGSKCMEHCAPGWYGADCKQPCHCAYGISNCNRITGACDGGCARGWRGNSCQIEDPNSNNTYIETTTMVYCNPGSYGPSCERQCHCAGNEHCHIVNGRCPSGCEDGWGGPTCGACRSGRFGDNCEFNCHCEGGHHNCDKDGFCYSGCEAGWAGFTCQTECTPGRFGPNCASSCHCYPNSTKPCDKITGVCEGDCEAGFMGKDCQTLCPQNMYGVNCKNTCICSNGAHCNRVDGSCTCEGRWRGNICNESEPQIIAATGEEVNTGHQVFISCTADAVPEPQMNISCSEFPGLKVSIRNLEQNQLQAVVKFKPEVSGNFEFLCTAKNEHGFDMKKMNLTVIDPPKLKSKPVLIDINNHSVSISWQEWKYSVDEGGSPVDRIEYLVVYKYLDAANWEKVDSWRMEEFNTIENLAPNTIYSIAVKCRRLGKGGEGEPGPILQVKTQCGTALPDGIPQEFLPEKITQSSMVLTWQNPSEALLRCPLVSYYMTYHPEALESIKGTINTEDIPTNVTVEDLTPNTNYVFRLYPITTLERSKYYAELIIRTSEIAPGPISNLECQAVMEKPDLLLVSWDAVSEENGAIKGYTVTSILVDKGQCGLAGGKDDLKTRQIQSDETEITLQNLHPYSIYNVSVQAKNSAGEGEPVSSLATTAESVPSESPTNVGIVSFTNTSLQFAWDAIPCEVANGEILYYEYVLIQNEDVVNVMSGQRLKKRSLDNHTHTIFDSVEDLSVTIKDLKPFTSYGFMVGGATSIGTGILSDIIFHKTDEGVPEQPQALSVDMVSHDSIEIVWEDPHHPNGIISLYRIKTFIRKTDQLIHEIVHHVNKSGDSGNSQVISDLSPNTDYLITVEASTKAGWGKNNMVFEKTLESAPGEPSKIIVVDHQQKSLNISWTEPLESNGIITGYKIVYQPISTLDPLFNTTSFTAEEIEFEANTTDAYIEDLHPSTQYAISVLAKTSVGYGSPANFTRWTTISGDHVSPSLKMLQINATSETIPILFSTTGKASVYKYQVIVEDSMNNDPIDEEQLTGFEEAVVKNELPYYIAAELDPSNVSEGEQTFVVGDKNTWGEYENVHLNPGHEYKIRIRTLVIKDKVLKSVLSKTKNETARTSSIVIERKKIQIAGLHLLPFILILIGSLVLATVLIFLTVLPICYRRERKKSTTSFSTKDSGLSGSMTWSVMYKAPDSDPTIDGHFVTDGFRTFPIMEKSASLKRCRSDSKIARGMRIETLEDYLLNARNTNNLAEEFKKLVEGQTSPWTVARKGVNLKKNRYGNILPYDRYRVVLQMDSSKKDDDYINASYIDGYRRPKEYIVTQGPLENTIGDFWRMIWQESCPVIVMITDLIENGKVKCAKYWPDDSMDCGDMHILLIHHEQTADYEVRTILMRKIDEIRTHRVLQYQYMGWPDRHVPMNTNSFIKFMKKVRDDHPVMSGPMTVHCSAGAGRSGTYLAIDALCQQAAEDRRVDVFRFVNNARHQRVHLVQTLEQYSFIYEALVEAIQYEDTCIPLQNISLYLKELDHMSTLDRRALIVKHYNKLNRTQKKVDVGKCSAALSEVNIFKNRDPLTVPSDSSRIKLEVIDYEDDQEDYINAIVVDGYRKQGAYLVTQMPLTHTIEDFYRMLYQYKSSLILMLNGYRESDEMSVGIYWPELGECKYGDFYVELVAFEEQGDFIIRVLKVTNLRKKNDEPLKTIQLQYNGWTSEMKPASILNLIEVVEMWHKRCTEGPITVHCMDGATRSGLFIASSYVYGQIKQEGILDAFHVVRSIRINRPEFIPNADQFRLLFEIAQEIAESILLQNDELSPTTKKLSFKI